MQSNTPTTEKKAENLKVGSIIRMTYCTYANSIKEDWTINKTFNCEGVEMIEYTANCKVSSITSNFFRVIIPHLNAESVRFSKRCFTNTKSSYADIWGDKAEIVTI